jgi:hypothetical protein
LAGKPAPYDLLVKGGRSIGLDDYSREKLDLVGKSGRERWSWRTGPA